VAFVSSQGQINIQHPTKLSFISPPSLPPSTFPVVFSFSC
jgi:hypothetical protein